MYDLLIKNGRIVDGTGNPWYRGDVGIKNEKIARIGKLQDEGADETIDAQGHVVSPGFINIHSHADFVFPLDSHPEILSGEIRQGVTTEVVGNCGYSPAPVKEENLELIQDYTGFLQAEELSWSWGSIGEFLDLVEEGGTNINMAQNVGQGTVRIAVMGFATGDADDEQLKEMRELVAQSFEEGVFGLTSGLVYAPGMYTSDEELIELAKVASEYGGYYGSHMRGSSETLIPATNEIMRIGEEADIPVQNHHIEAFGEDFWPKIDEVLENIEEARERGVDFTYDVIPYTYANTTLTATLPPWSLEGGVPKLLERLKDEETREQIKKEIKTTYSGYPSWTPRGWPHNLARATGWENIIPIWTKGDREEIYGKSIAQIAEEKEKDPADCALNLIEEEKGQVMCLYVGCSGDLENKEPLLKWFRQQNSSGELNLEAGAAPETDAILLGKGTPHPSGYGAFPKLFSYLVREKNIFTLEEAVRRVTSFPARKVGLKKRGLLLEDFYADVTIFDPEAIEDKATWEDPKRYPEGIDYVIVNGEIVVDHGDHDTESRSGKVLRKC